MYLIQQAANILDISEYDVLRLAYIDWHGTGPDLRTLNEAFSRHFRDGNPPHWARHYARKVVEEFEAQHFGRCAVITTLLNRLLMSNRRDDDTTMMA